MSRDFDNTNRGVLFKNEDKQEDSHADYSGNINVDGQEFWLNAWIKRGKESGKAFMSLSVKPKQPSKGGGAAPKKGKALDADDIPFAPERGA